MCLLVCVAFLVATLALSYCFEFNLQVRCLFLAGAFALADACQLCSGKKGKAVSPWLNWALKLP